MCGEFSVLRMFGQPGRDCSAEDDLFGGVKTKRYVKNKETIVISEMPK